MKWKEEEKYTKRKVKLLSTCADFFRWNSSFSLIYRTHTPSSKILWEQRPVNCIISSHLFQADFPFFIPQSIYSAPVLLVGAVRLDLDFIINIIYLLWLLQWKWEKISHDRGIVTANLDATYLFTYWLTTAMQKCANEKKSRPSSS